LKNRIASLSIGDRRTLASPDNSVAVIPPGRRLSDEFRPEFPANYIEISSRDSVSEISSHR
jgi:hypothetical protein